MALFWIIIGYLAGSCPTGYLIAKALRGVDVRTFGSGNIGATNVGRLMGKKYAVFVAAFDMLKGGIVVLAASYFTQNAWTLALTGAFAVIGHNFPVWLKFKGGKGVATTFGVIGFYDFFTPWPALLGGAVWYLVMRCTKYVSLGSIFGLFASAFLIPVFDMPKPYFYVSLALACMSALRHSSNIKRLLAGTETKV